MLFKHLGDGDLWRHGGYIVQLDVKPFTSGQCQYSDPNYFMIMDISWLLVLVLWGSILLVRYKIV